ncbi:MAG: fasciclin domain-containing protein, partial [Bacteroidales bacterium]|nr:fasciclin domain-containing protein [Bacteroidales bacterium]
MKTKGLLFMSFLMASLFIFYSVKSQTTVVDIVVNSHDHDTLEAAVIAAGLADDLAGEGPFTVFAPTDDAFKALPAGTLEILLADPTGTLADILLYHVVGAKAMSTDLS